MIIRDKDTSRLCSDHIRQLCHAPRDLNHGVEGVTDGRVEDDVDRVVVDWCDVLMFDDVALSDADRLRLNVTLAEVADVVYGAVAVSISTCK